MQNPTEFDPRRRHLDGEDCDHDKDDKKGDGMPNPFEKALFESRTLLISGPVDDKMLKEATIRAMAMEAKDATTPITVFINSPGGSADAAAGGGPRFSTASPGCWRRAGWSNRECSC